MKGSETPAMRENCAEGRHPLFSPLGPSRLKLTHYRASEEQARLERRLDVLDSRYESLVASMCDRPGTYKRVTAYQNGMSRKLGRKGLAYDPVSVQLRDYAESMLLETLERNPEHPSVKLLLAELDEAAAIRKRLTALAETEAFGAPRSTDSLTSPILARGLYVLPWVSAVFPGQIFPSFVKST